MCANRIPVQDGVYDAVEKVEAHIAAPSRRAPLEYGIVGINEGIISTEIAPFGGIKESGVDRWFDGENGISYVYLTCIVEKPMQVQVARWGNSLGLRIPKDIALRAGLREGARVEVEAEGDRIIISLARPRYLLAELLKGMTPEAMRDAFDWGPDKGREIVE
jgi:antitoxin MazE